jgi:hypothetical protein
VRLAAVLERALDPQARRRHDTAADLAAALRSLQRSAALSARGTAILTATALMVGALTGGLFLAREVVPGSVGLAVVPFAMNDDRPEAGVLREGLTRDLITRLETSRGWAGSTKPSPHSSASGAPAATWATPTLRRGGSMRHAR